MDYLKEAGVVAVSLKPVADLAKSLIDALGTGKVREQAVKLYGEILSAQEGALASNAAQAILIKEKRELETRIAELESWEREKARYELVEIARGVFARQLKAAAANEEPIHRICANCYENRKKLILQSDGHPGKFGGTEHLKCFGCNATIDIPHIGQPFPDSYGNDIY